LLAIFPPPPFQPVCAPTSPAARVNIWHLKLSAGRRLLFLFPASPFFFLLRERVPEYHFRSAGWGAPARRLLQPFFPLLRDPSSNISRALSCYFLVLPLTGAVCQLTFHLVRPFFFFSSRPVFSRTKGPSPSPLPSEQDHSTTTFCGPAA